MSPDRIVDPSSLTHQAIAARSGLTLIREGKTIVKVEGTEEAIAKYDLDIQEAHGGNKHQTARFAGFLRQSS